MKKLLAVLFVLAFVAPAMADDTLDVSGEYRVEFYDIAGRQGGGISFSDADANQDNFIDQRFRLQLKVKPSDGVVAVLRGDFAEGEWGQGGMPQGEEDRPDAGTNDVIMIDKAYVQISKSIVKLTVGLQGYSLGDSFGYNNQGTGVDIKIAPKPATIRLGYTKITETNGNLSDEDGFEDVDQSYIDFGMKFKGFAFNLYAAGQQDGTDNNNEPMMVGALVKAKAGPVNIKAFIESFGGENEAADYDYTGLQFYADVNAKLSSAIKVGAELVYSDGEEEDDENKTTRMPNAYAAYRTYIDRGPAKGTVVLNPFGSANDMFNLDLDTNGGAANNEPGAMGIRPYIDWKILPVFSVSANIGYFEPETETDEVDSAITYGASLLWTMAPKTTFGLGYMVWDIDECSDYSNEVEDFKALYGILKVKF